jgi:hypothetical protein
MTTVTAVLIACALLGVASVTCAPLEKVMFSVRKMKSWTNPGNSGKWKTIDFDQEDTNVPSGVFDLDLDVFKAPTSGYYNLQVDCTSYVYKNLHITILINGQAMAEARDTGSLFNNNTGSGGTNTIIFLRAGNQASVGIYDSTNNGVKGNSCVFSGFLLQAA